MHCFLDKEPMNAEEYCRKPFTLHFSDVSRLVTEIYRSEGLLQPFTTLHYPSLSGIGRFSLVVDKTENYVKKEF